MLMSGNVVRARPADSATVLCTERYCFHCGRAAECVPVLHVCIPYYWPCRSTYWLVFVWPRWHPTRTGETQVGVSTQQAHQKPDTYTVHPASFQPDALDALAM